MKKIRSAEFLAAVAIITSATVLQIREHLKPIEAPAVGAQTASGACGIKHDGFVPASCEPTREERPAETATPRPHGAPRMWV